MSANQAPKVIIGQQIKLENVPVASNKFYVLLHNHRLKCMKLNGDFADGMNTSDLDVQGKKYGHYFDSYNEAYTATQKFGYEVVELVDEL